MGDGKGNAAIEMRVYTWVMERVMQQLKCEFMHG